MIGWRTLDDTIVHIQLAAASAAALAYAHVGVNVFEAHEAAFKVSSVVLAIVGGGSHFSMF